MKILLLLSLQRVSPTNTMFLLDYLFQICLWDVHSSRKGFPMLFNGIKHLLKELQRMLSFPLRELKSLQDPSSAQVNCLAPELSGIMAADANHVLSEWFCSPRASFTSIQGRKARNFAQLLQKMFGQQTRDAIYSSLNSSHEADAAHLT